MMSKGLDIQQRPIDFVEALCILFIGLDIMGHIDWPWYWIASPLWIKFLFHWALSVAFDLWIKSKKE